MTTPTSEAPPGSAAAPPEPATTLTHGCVRCGRPVPLDVAMCDRCNPLGLKDPAASQVHGTVFVVVFVAIVVLAFLARMTVSGVGPFQAQVTDAVAVASGLELTLAVTNDGSAAGQSTCRVTDPAERYSGKSAYVLTPPIEPRQTITFEHTATELGTAVRPLHIECAAP